jgi:hypothetical protein
MTKMYQYRVKKVARIYTEGNIIKNFLESFQEKHYS